MATVGELLAAWTLEVQALGGVVAESEAALMAAEVTMTGLAATVDVADGLVTVVIAAE